MAEEHNISFHQGAAVIIEDTIKGTGDISAWVLLFGMRRDYGMPIEVSKAKGSGITITDGPNRKFQIALAHADTLALPAGDHYWDVWRTDVGAENPLTYGKVALEPSVAV